MSAAATLKRPPETSDHHLGTLNSSIMIVEYADFACPFSAELAGVLDKVMRQYKDICLVSRHFPLTSVHPNAGIAAMAAEAAGKQHKFWEMHHLLFKHYSALDPESVFHLARELRLDMRRFLNDLEEENLLERVQRDFRGGMENAIDGTPTLFINGILYEGDLSVQGISAEIDQILTEDQIRP